MASSMHTGSTWHLPLSRGLAVSVLETKYSHDHKGTLNLQLRPVVLLVLLEVNIWIKANWLNLHKKTFQKGSQQPPPPPLQKKSKALPSFPCCVHGQSQQTIHLHDGRLPAKYRPPKITLWTKCNLPHIRKHTVKDKFVLVFHQVNLCSHTYFVPYWHTVARCKQTEQLRSDRSHSKLWEKSVLSSIFNMLHVNNHTEIQFNHVKTIKFSVTV